MAEQHPEKAILEDDADWLDFDMAIIFLVVAFVVFFCIISSIWFFMKRGKKARRHQLPRQNAANQPIHEPIIITGEYPTSQEPLVVSMKPSTKA